MVWVFKGYIIVTHYHEVETERMIGVRSYGYWISVACGELDYNVVGAAKIQYWICNGLFLAHVNKSLVHNATSL